MGCVPFWGIIIEAERIEKQIIVNQVCKKVKENKIKKTKQSAHCFRLYIRANYLLKVL